MKRLLILCLALGAIHWGVPAPALCASQDPAFSLSTTNTTYWPILKKGNRGTKVKALQLLLNTNGSKLKADSLFGASTESAIKKYQKEHDLKIDGIVGAQTWEDLVVPVKRGSRGPYVRIFQGLLVQNGYRVKQDGVFGLATEKSVMRFTQKVAGASSKKGETSVWCYLLGGFADGGD